MVAPGETSSAGSAQVCVFCKIRHRKCDWEQDACLQCRNAGIECVRQPTFKFRYHPKQKELFSASSQLWQPCPMPRVPVRFQDETPDLVAIYQGEGNHRVDDGEASCEVQLHSPPQKSPAQIAFLSGFADETPDNGHIINYDPSDVSPSGHHEEILEPLSPTEAFLVRNFTDRMAQWTDIADPFRTFETHVSRLALTDPVIRYAICAFSARHFYRCQRGEDGEAEALDYQNRCLNLIIPAMSGGQRITESILTAVALLRQNEEMDGKSVLYIFNLSPSCTTLLQGTRLRLLSAAN